jgi:ActR/RegA family two-component response regulator
MLLEYHGFESFCATTPDAAMELARNDQPGVAVVDLGLPTEDQGWNLISRLKQSVPEISIVVLTGFPATAAKGHPERSSVNAWITKGSGASTLIETLNRLA